jgi:hypothetical protein
MKRKGRKNPNTKFYVGGAILGIALIAMLCIAYAPFSPWYMWWVEDDTATTPTTKAYSTFTLIDYVTGEDVSDWVEITVWEPTSAADFDNDEDPFIRTNFEEMESSKDAADVAVDLRDGAYYWVEIDPDDDVVYGGYDAFAASGHPTRYGALTDDYRFIVGGANYDYLMYVFHLPYNTSINVLNRTEGVGHVGAAELTADEWLIGTHGVGAANVPTGNGTYTVYLDVPMNATEGLHTGSTGAHDWDMDSDVTDLFDWEDLRWSQDQRNFRTQAPFYDIQDDTEREFDDELEVLTNAFCVRFTFNVSVNHNASCEVTFELVERNYENYPIEVVEHATFIDCIFYEPITFSEGDLPSFDFNITVKPGTLLAQGIGVTRVSCGRIAVPQDQSALGAFYELSRAPLPVA